MPEAVATPPPVAAPAAPPSNVPGGPTFDAAYAAFDHLVQPPETAPEPEPKPDLEPPAEKPVAKETPDPKPAPAKPVVAPKPGDQKPVKAATLRDELERTRSEFKTLKEQHDKFVAESKTAKPDPERERIVKEYEDLKKVRTELENELRFSNYERSPEYKEKFLAPFANAYEGAKKLMPALSFKEPDKTDEFGTVTEGGAMRKGTEADWDRLMSITDEDAANKFITEHFGHNAARVTLLRDKVLDLNGQRLGAIEDYRKQGTERETQSRESQARMQEETKQRWTDANKRALEKFPQYFAPDPADAKGNELLEHGSRLTDLAFGALSPDQVAKLPPSIQAKMVNGKLPPEEMTILHSAVRNRSAAYDRLIHRAALKDAEIAELKTKLDGFEKSSPGRGQERRVDGKTKPAVPNTFADVDSAFEKLAAGNA